MAMDREPEEGVQSDIVAGQELAPPRVLTELLAAIQALHASAELRAGLEVVILSGRRSPAVAVRARELKIERVFLGINYKLPKLEELLEDDGVRTRIEHSLAG